MPSKLFTTPARTVQFLRFLMPFTVMVLCLWILETQINLPSVQDVGGVVAQVAPMQWFGAFSATCISFWALGRYDMVAHRHFGTNFGDRSVRGAGMASIALSQTVGFGLITGSFARWRLLPGLRPLQAAQVTTFVAVTFLAALAAICAVCSILLPMLATLKWIGALTLLFLCAAAGLSLAMPEIHLGRYRLRLPSITAMLALGIWAVVDVTAAGTALWFLLPDGISVSWSVILPIYFVALGASIISSAPGGIGPFELTLYALLPGQNSGDLLAAIIAFRVVYFACPALVSAVVLAWPKVLRPVFTPSNGVVRLPASSLPDNCIRSETGVIRQNGGNIIKYGSSHVAVLDSPQCAIALFDPLATSSSAGVSWLQTYARDRNAVAGVYKCTALTAASLRRTGWKVLRIAEEAVLTPQDFTDDGSSRRQLRRKLRQAAKAGVEVRAAAAHLPVQQMALVDQVWQHANGPARGTTMGRFDPEYLAQQKVFLAWHKQEIIGFVSFHVSTQEWCLDLVRILPGAPDGTGHALVREAIATAADRCVPRLSLAAVPDHRLAQRVDKGLRRFKACFAPRWQPLYISAPNWWQLTVSIGELIRLVHRPPDLVPTQMTVRPHSKTTTFPLPHNEDEQNKIALSRSA